MLETDYAEIYKFVFECLKKKGQSTWPVHVKPVILLQEQEYWTCDIYSAPTGKHQPNYFHKIPRTALYVLNDNALVDVDSVDAKCNFIQYVSVH